MTKGVGLVALEDRDNRMKPYRILLMAPVDAYQSVSLTTPLSACQAAFDIKETRH